MQLASCKSRTEIPKSTLNANKVSSGWTVYSIHPRGGEQDIVVGV